MHLNLMDDTRIASLLDDSGVQRELEAAFSDLAAGRASIFARSRIDCHDIKLSAMGAIWQARGVAGIKSYPTIGGQFSFLITLFDTEINEPIALLQANEITRFRTAALTSVVARRAAHKHSRKLALIGAGVQGRAIAKSLAHAFRLEQICIADPALRKGSSDALSRELGARVQVCEAEDAVREADIVVTASRSKSPVLQGSWLKPGAFVAAVGTSLPNGRELDDATMAAAGRVLVEWKPQSLVEAGEVVLARANGSLAEDRIFDLAELYRQDAPWRASDDEIVVFKSVGVGLADVATAWLAVECAKAQAQQPVEAVMSQAPA